MSLSSKIRSILWGIGWCRNGSENCSWRWLEKEQNAVLYKCAKGRNSDMALNSYFDFAENDFQYFKASYDAGIV